MSEKFEMMLYDFFSLEVGNSEMKFVRIIMCAFYVRFADIGFENQKQII